MVNESWYIKVVWWLEFFSSRYSHFEHSTKIGYKIGTFYKTEKGPKKFYTKTITFNKVRLTNFIWLTLLVNEFWYTKVVGQQKIFSKYTYTCNALNKLDTTSEHFTTVKMPLLLQSVPTLNQILLKLKMYFEKYFQPSNHLGVPEFVDQSCLPN